jgi:hypothetical protein
MGKKKRIFDDFDSDYETLTDTELCEYFYTFARIALIQSKRKYSVDEAEDIRQELVMHCWKKKEKYNKEKGKACTFFIFITYIKLKELQRNELKKRTKKDKETGKEVRISIYPTEDPIKERLLHDRYNGNNQIFAPKTEVLQEPDHSTSVKPD